MMEDIDSEQTPFSDLITRLLANFASSRGTQIDSHIERALGEVGSFIAADYAIVIQASADMATWSVTHEWCGAGVPSHLAEYQDFFFGTFDWSAKLLKRNCSNGARSPWQRRSTASGNESQHAPIPDEHLGSPASVVNHRLELHSLLLSHTRAATR